MASLQALTYLSLDGNDFAEFPPVLCSLHQLRRLYISGTRRPHLVLPDAFGQLTQLESLTLAENGLTSVPSAIGNLSSLTYLGLYDNMLAQACGSCRS